MAKFNDKRKEIKNIISALFTALWYDASSNYVVEVVKDVKSMIISGGNREVADVVNDELIKQYEKKG